MEYVTQVANVAHVVDILQAHNDSFEFANTDNTILFVMYANKKLDGNIVVDLEYLDAWGKNRRVYEMLKEFDDEEQPQFGEIFSIVIDKYDDEDRKRRAYAKITKKINELYNLRFCPCGKRLRAHGRDACLSCILTCPEEYSSLPIAYCCVCMENSTSYMMTKMPCCGNFLHKLCALPLSADRCPYCRFAL